MKAYVKIILIGVMLFASQVSIAESVVRVSPIAVTVAVEVQKQMQKASPEVRKQLEAAINTGNKFIPHHFDGSAYDPAGGDNEAWFTYTAPLIAMNMEEWVVKTDGIEHVKTVKNGKFDAYGTRMICPQVLLISAQRKAETTVLTYRARSAGRIWRAYEELGDFYVIDVEGVGQVYEIQLELNAAHLVSQVAVSDDLATFDHQASIAPMMDFVREPLLRIGLDTKELMKERLIRYPKVIKATEEQVARVCK